MAAPAQASLPQEDAERFQMSRLRPGCHGWLKQQQKVNIRLNRLVGAALAVMLIHVAMIACRGETSL